MASGNGGGSHRGVVVEDLPSVTARTPGPATPQPIRAATIRRRRHIPWFLLGVTFAGLCGIGVGVVVKHVGNQQQVLVAARTIPAGHAFEPRDFRLASISEGDVNVLAANREDDLIGRTAAVTIESGAPLVAGDIGAPAVASGTAIVAVLCKPGQFPPSLTPGQHVQIVVAGPAASSAAGGVAEPSPPVGVVVAVDAPSDAGLAGTVVTLQLDQPDATTVAQAGADGHVSLVVVGSGG